MRALPILLLAALATSPALHAQGFYDIDTVRTIEITFAEQAADISMGRFPNGTGALAAMRPSFAAENTGTVVRTEEADGLPSEAVSLLANYPNPFSGSTSISFSPREASPVTPMVYNALGQRVEALVSQDLSAGNHTVTWRADGYAPGVYVYRLQAGATAETRTMTLVR